MPAAAVIPAPIAYIKVVAVKKPVVEFREGRRGAPRNSEHDAARDQQWRAGPPPPYLLGGAVSLLRVRPRRSKLGYFDEIRVFKAGDAPEYISME